MSIPTTEIKPDGIYRAPRPQIRSVRELIQNAGIREINDFIDNLIKRSQVVPRYFAQVGLGAVLLLIGILTRLPLLVLIAAITAPVLNPIVGLVAAGVRPSTKHMVRSFIYLIVTLILFFAVGWLSHFFNPASDGAIETLQTFTTDSGWLEWAVLVVISVIAILLFLYRENIPSVVTSSVLVYLVFLPVCLAGVLTARGEFPTAVNHLVLAGSRLLVSLILMIITTWIVGFQPKQALGWLLLALTIIAAVLLINELRGHIPVSAEPMPVMEMASELSPAVTLPAAQPSAEPIPTQAPTKQPTAIPTATAMPEPTPVSATELAEPQPRLAEVTAVSGVVVREAPSLSSLILTYLNQGETVTLLGEQATDQGVVWEKIELRDGVVGWAASSWLQVIED